MYPTVTLDKPHVAQQPYQSDQVAILKVDDDTENKTLRAFVQLGDNPSFKHWVPVLSGDDYTVDWNNETVVAAIKAYFAGLANA